jgi:hypothetical protein
MQNILTSLCWIEVSRNRELHNTTPVANTLVPSADRARHTAGWKRGTKSSRVSAPERIASACGPLPLYPFPRDFEEWPSQKAN